MENSNYNTEIIFTNTLLNDLIPVTGLYPGGKVFLATETTVHKLWIHNQYFFRDIPAVILQPGEENKNLSSVAVVWSFLSENGADRKSLLINVGGGMLTDLCGFAASTFKRGIDFVNIPTTLLSQVDASIGGKTGINFHGLKNEIGTFRDPVFAFIHSPFLETLDRQNFLSGYAEMIKHGLIGNPQHLTELQDFDVINVNYTELQEIIRHSVYIKKYFITNDPFEKNIRKALNFGHTIGHAIESLFMEQGRPLLHGFAVAYGMVAELFLSAEQCGFPFREADRISRWIIQLFNRFSIGKADFERLFDLMRHDKKNEGDRINFTLLSCPGKYEINRDCRKDQILESLRYLQTL